MPWTSGAILTAAQLNLYAPQAWSTWTPTISNSSGSYTTVAVNRARYCQHGKTVVWQLQFTITTVGTATGTPRFTLPVTAVTTPLILGYGREHGSSGTMLQVVTQTTTQANVFDYLGGVNMNANGRSALLGGTYEAA